MREVIRVVVLDYCIEEWLCIGLGIKWRGDPLAALKTRHPRYEKYMLGDFAAKLDMDRLMRSRSFGEFVKALADG